MRVKSERPGRRQNHSWTAEQYGNTDHCQKSYLLVSIMHISVNKGTYQVNSLKDVRSNKKKMCNRAWHQIFPQFSVEVNIQLCFTWAGSAVTHASKYITLSAHTVQGFLNKCQTVLHSENTSVNKFVFQNDSMEWRPHIYLLGKKATKTKTPNVWQVWMILQCTLWDDI